MKKKIKNIFIIILLVLILISISILVFKLKNVEEIEITQLSSQTNDRMMGYIITTKEGQTIVIDGGMDTDADNFKKNIEACGNKIDYWILTHPHRDHVGTFINIVESSDIEIKNLYYCINDIDWYRTYASDRVGEVENFLNALNNEKIMEINKEQPAIGEIININENIKIEILGINNPEITTNPINNSSMVFKLYVNDKSILFLGDTGAESSQKLIEKYGENLKSDIVQVAHHGNDGAVEELYKLVQPEICFWPTPEWLWNNDSGQGYNTGSWTTLETREWMNNLGVKENYIAKDGDIKVKVK